MDKEDKSKKAAADIFKDVDENMELDLEERKQLEEFETVNKDGKEIDFEKVQLKDLVVKIEHRRVPVPRHRFAPLKSNWDSILKTLVEHMKLQVRMNTKRRAVEIRTCSATEDIGAIQKAADFLKAFMLGFEI